MNKLIVAIPAFNEEQTIGHVIKQIRSSIPDNLELYVLIVDDGSSDETIEISKKAGADIVVSHKSNQGVSNAFNSCIKFALEYNADIICTIDADAQFSPTEIKKVIAPVETGSSEVVIGSRFLTSQNINRVPILNTITNKIMAILVSLLVGKRFYDVESGFRALSARAARNLNLLGKGSFSHDMILDLSIKGFRISEVPVGVKYYKDRTSRVIKSLLQYGIASLWSIILKTLAIRNHYNSSSENPQSATVIYLTPTLQ